MKTTRVHLCEGEGRNIKNFQRNFIFESGTNIEINYRSEGCWQAVRGTSNGQNCTYGYGSTGRAAVKNLRQNLAMRTLHRIDPTPRAIFDEMDDANWEEILKQEKLRR